MFKKLKGLLSGLKVKIENKVNNSDNSLVQGLWNAVTLPFAILNGDLKKRAVEKVARHIEMRMKYSHEELEYIRKEFVTKILMEIKQDKMIQSILNHNPIKEKYLENLANKYADEFIKIQKRPEAIIAMLKGQKIPAEILRGKEFGNMKEYGQTGLHGYKPAKELTKFFDKNLDLYSAIKQNITTSLSSQYTEKMFDAISASKGHGTYLFGILPRKGNDNLPLQEILYDFDNNRFIINNKSRYDINHVIETHYASSFDELKSLLFKNTILAVDTNTLYNTINNLLKNHIEKPIGFLNTVQNDILQEELKNLQAKNTKKLPVEFVEKGIEKEKTQGKEAEITNAVITPTI